MKLSLKKLILVCASSLSVACSDNGDSHTIPLPIDPPDAVAHIVTPGQQAFHIDLFENPVSIDNALCAHGNNLRFAEYGTCNGVGYIREIPREGWTLHSTRLREGTGYIVAELCTDGCNIAAMYVDSISSNGKVYVKTLSPQYGTFGRFAVNTKKINIRATQNDTTLYLIHPTTYTAELQKGEWMTTAPNVTYIQLFFGNNNTGRERSDIIHLHNGIHDDVDIQVVQAP